MPCYALDVVSISCYSVVQHFAIKLAWQQQLTTKFWATATQLQKQQQQQQQTVKDCKC